MSNLIENGDGHVEPKFVVTNGSVKALSQIVIASKNPFPEQPPVL